MIHLSNSLVRLLAYASLAELSSPYFSHKNRMTKRKKTKEN